MQELKVGDRVYHHGLKKRIFEIGPPLNPETFYRVSEFGWFPRSKLKPIIRLTPLVRAKILLDVWAWENYRPEVRDLPLNFIDELGFAVALIDLIGGEEAAHLYDHCDGCVNGQFIRGDDVRQALRILGGI